MPGQGQIMERVMEHKSPNRENEIDYEVWVYGDKAPAAICDFMTVPLAERDNARRLANEKFGGDGAPLSKHCSKREATEARGHLPIYTWKDGDWTPENLH